MKITTLFIGVDGCSSGWISSYKEDQIKWKFAIFPTIERLWNAFSNVKLIMIDIPIGLRDKGNEPRLCDKEARKYLTRSRSSSIFPTPCRSATYAASYILANKLNRESTGKGLSKQTWNITGKIREVDVLLRNDSKARHIFIESHPELCFAALSNSIPMKHYKKKEDGIKERLLVIESFCKNSKQILNEVILQFSKKELSVDDILDAWILAISGSKGISNLRFLPDSFEYDSEGLPMRMAIPNFR